jgi:hypothetical protein
MWRTKYVWRTLYVACRTRDPKQIVAAYGWCWDVVLGRRLP